jgi:hypothetical protein
MMNDEMNELRNKFALTALRTLALKTFDPDIQRLARDAGIQESEVIATYCWQIADDMMRMMNE